MRLRDFRVLSFDCYGTLIDWESGILEALQPLLGKAAMPRSRDQVLEAFARFESAQERATPDMLYPDVLAAVHRRLAEEFGLPASEAEHRRFGQSVPDWPPFADSADALRYLKGHYQLVILSNVDRRSFAASNERLGVVFEAIYVAEEIGSYKPDPANFSYMLDRLAQRGVDRSLVLHTAQSLFHDHGPARRFGLATAWIDRRHERDGWGATPPPADVSYDFRFKSLAEMAAAHRAETSHDPRP